LKPSLAILATNYNTWDLTTRCVDACVQQDAGHFDKLYIYDDCSTIPFTGTFPGCVQLIRGAKNLGLTRALNAAFASVEEDVVVLFDSDAYPTTPFCLEVSKLFEADPQLGLVALRTVGTSGAPSESYTTEPNLWSLLLGQALYAKFESSLADRSGRVSVFTCAMAIRKSAFDEIGGFDENFDWLDLDHDFSMRMNRSRWRVKIAPDARIFHEGGGTPQETRHRLLRFYKTRWYLLRKFDRIAMPLVAKWLILLRLSIEYAVLKIFGALLIKNRMSLKDKVEGRKALLKYCYTHYR
jgi:GT2 family glycosyltransferase